MLKCLKCNKKFKYESDLNRHKNRKTSCDKKDELKCNYCNLSFTCSYNKSVHEKTKKHINNYNTEINGYIEDEDLKLDIEQYKLKIKELNDEKNILNNKIKILEYDNKGLISLLNILV
jgi:DNA-directed RNA polymerase subunit RPC12/RpoP